jgi:conjugal transfer pilus assembly protein TraU
VKKIAVVVLLAFFMPFMAKEASGEECENSNVISGRILTDVCWDCIFPLKVAGMEVGNGPAGEPDGAASYGWLCNCYDNNGVLEPGVPISMWKPTYLVEQQLEPGCLSALNGWQWPSDPTRAGVHSGKSYKSHYNPESSMHYRVYAFPLLFMLDLFTQSSCPGDGYTEFDVMWMAEFDPTWFNPTLSWFTTPEALLILNPLAINACIKDIVQVNAGSVEDSLFWCAGSQGMMYPYAGKDTHGLTYLGAATLFTQRAIASYHRRGFMRRLMGNDAMCEAPFETMMSRSQYRYQLMNPEPDAKNSHVFGKAVATWEGGKVLPGGDKTPIFVIFKWDDCCER